MKRFLFCGLLFPFFLSAQIHERMNLGEIGVSVIIPDEKAYAEIGDMYQSEDGTFLQGIKIAKVFNKDSLIINAPLGVEEKELRTIADIEGVWYKGKMTKENGAVILFYSFLYSCGTETCLISGGLPRANRRKLEEIKASIESMRPNVHAFDALDYTLNAAGWELAAKLRIGDILYKDDMEMMVLQRKNPKQAGGYFNPAILSPDHRWRSDDLQLIRWLLTKHFNLDGAVVKKLSVSKVANLHGLLAEGERVDTVNGFTQGFYAQMLFKDDNYYCIALSFPTSWSTEEKANRLKIFTDLVATFQLKEF